MLRDSQLYRVAALYSASLGLSVAIGNWVVTLLDRHGGVDKGAAGAIAALTLALGVFTRPLGGWILREHPERIRLAVGASLAGGAAGSILLAIALPPAVAVLGAVLVGAAAGIPFSPAFTGAALRRPDAPAAAVGFVNETAGGAILVLTPLLGLTFSLPGERADGLAIAAALGCRARRSAQLTPVRSPAPSRVDSRALDRRLPCIPCGAWRSSSTGVSGDPTTRRTAAMPAADRALGRRAAVVTLRRSPPLDVTLRVADGQVWDGETLVAEVGPAQVELEPVPPPSWRSPLPRT